MRRHYDRGVSLSFCFHIGFRVLYTTNRVKDKVTEFCDDERACGKNKNNQKKGKKVVSGCCSNVAWRSDCDCIRTFFLLLPFFKVNLFLLRTCPKEKSGGD